MTEIKVYTIDEVASLLHVTKRTVYSYIKYGRLRAVKIGKYWRVTQENLEDFLSIENSLVIIKPAEAKR